MPAYIDGPGGVQTSLAYREAMAVSPIGRAVLYLLEVYHPALPDGALRFALNHEDVTATLEADAPRDAGTAQLHLALPLGFQLPTESDGSAAPGLRMWIDGVSSHVTDSLDATVETLDDTELILRVYASDDLNAPAKLPVLRMPLRSTTVGEERVVVTAAFTDPVNEAFPRKTFTRREYPGLGN
jgi:hypothetical protein